MLKEKKCTKCGELKCLQMFSRNKGTKDGLASWCKGCTNVSSAAYRQTPEGKKKHREQLSRYSKTPERKALRRSYQKAYAKRPGVSLKIEARRRTEIRIRRGELLPARDCECYHCSKQADLHHHHNGYEEKNWDDTVPLCYTCHSEEHVLLEFN